MLSNTHQKYESILMTLTLRHQLYHNLSLLSTIHCYSISLENLKNGKNFIFADLPNAYLLCKVRRLTLPNQIVDHLDSKPSKFERQFWSNLFLIKSTLIWIKSILKAVKIYQSIKIDGLYHQFNKNKTCIDRFQDCY